MYVYIYVYKYIYTSAVSCGIGCIHIQPSLFHVYLENECVYLLHVYARNLNLDSADSIWKYQISISNLNPIGLFFF